MSLLDWLMCRWIDLVMKIRRCPECKQRGHYYGMGYARELRWAIDPIVQKFGWAEGRCHTCGANL